MSEQLLLQHPGWTITLSVLYCPDVDGPEVRQNGRYYNAHWLFLYLHYGRTDVDDCHMLPGTCWNSCCYNTHWLFLYLHYVCTDVDECFTVPGVCENGRCYNTQGGFRCDCNPGYETSEDGKACYGKLLITTDM